MSVKKTTVIDTGLNSFTTDKEYNDFYSNFLSDLANYHQTRKSYEMQQKILSTERWYQENKITFITIFSDEISLKEYEQEPNLQDFYNFLTNIGWSVSSSAIENIS